MSGDKDGRRVRFSLGDCASCTSIRRSQYTINQDYGGALPNPSMSRRSRRSRSIDRSRSSHVHQSVRVSGLPGGRGSRPTMSPDPSIKSPTPTLSLSSTDVDLDMDFSDRSSQCTQPTDPYRVMPLVYSPAPTPGVQRQPFVYVIGDKSMSPVPVVVAETETREEAHFYHKRLALVVFFLCGFLFGLVAFLLAVAADRKKKTNAKSRQLGQASLAVSISGIVVGVALVISISVGMTLSKSVCLPSEHCH